MEQQLQKFMIQQFHPSGVSFRDGHENISEQLGPYFMPISGDAVYATRVIATPEIIFKPIPSHVVNDNINPPVIIKERENRTGNEKKNLDQYWAFWAAYIAANGMKAYENIPEKERFRFRLEQKAKASEWMVEDFKRTKAILASHWYRLTNRDMEDMATSLMTNADESKEGLDCMVMMWNYYLYHDSTSGCVNAGVKNQSELYWVHSEKKVFYKLSMTKMDTNETVTESIPSVGPVWGVFVTEKAGKMDNKKRNFYYELRKLVREVDKTEIEKNAICLSYVDKPLMAVSKYTLKELVDMGDVFGVRPPPSEKTTGNLDMENLISESEKNLGVVRKKPSVVKATEEKWKKGVWYENLEMYLSEIF